MPTRWIAAAGVLVWLVSGAYMFHYGAPWHLDLRVYRAAGDALYHGGSPFTAYFTANRLPFTYTPFALLVLSPLALGRLGLVEAGWWLVSAASLIGTVALTVRASFTISTGRAWAVAGLLSGVASLALEPVRSNFNYGQVNLILMVMIVADVCVVRSPWKGVLVGLAAAIKLTPLVFLFYFVATRDWRALLRSAGVVVGVTAISWAILPSDSARYWFHQVFDASRTGSLGVVSNQSWNGMLHRPPFDGGQVATAAWLVLSVATLVCGAVVCRWMVGEGRTAGSGVRPGPHRAPGQPGVMDPPLVVAGPGPGGRPQPVEDPSGGGNRVAGTAGLGRVRALPVAPDSAGVLPGQQLAGVGRGVRPGGLGDCRAPSSSLRPSTARHPAGDVTAPGELSLPDRGCTPCSG